MRRSPICFFTVFILVLQFLSCKEQNVAPPNVILIMTDDQGY